MSKNNKTNYDVIIIGAGISGLVCACYLARAGMKVLVIEQHDKPGGYCTSFKRKGFLFDAAAHCFGGYRKDGITRRVFDNLEIDKKIKIKQYNPSNIIITPDSKISIWSDLNETIESFQEIFPEESNNIKEFFNCLINADHIFFSQLRSWTFENLLDNFFRNDKLKAILSAPLLGFLGLPPSLMSAFIGARLFTEYILDGGYHPEVGMQALPEALTERFKEFGGELRLSCLVKKIKIKDNKIVGIFLDDSDFIPSKYVISNCDARQTFFKLIGKEWLKEEFYHKIKNMIPSMSNFILYLGLDGYFESLPEHGTTLCFLKDYNLYKSYQTIQKADFENFEGHMLRVFRDTSTLLSIIPAPHNDKRFWDNNKHRITESLINKIEKYTIPNLSKHIVYKDAATPHTLYRYTLNYKGASYGWAGTPSQLAVQDLRKPSFIEGLYLTGHWTTLGVGISGVVYVAYDTAKMILRKERAVFTTSL